MTVHLPPEIWQIIASHLPPDIVQDLYSVNRALFAIAMEEKYRFVRFASCQDYHRNIDCLTYPAASRHVRHLLLSSLMITDLPPSSKQRRKGVIAKILQRLPHHGTTKKDSELKPLLQIMHNLSGVTSLELHALASYELSAFKLLLPIVTAGWTTFGNSLRSLKLTLSLEGFSLALPPSLTFPSLEDLHVLLSSTYHTTDATNILFECCAPFINNHHSTLRSLRLCSYGERLLDISPFLHRLRRFPHLTTFRLSDDFISIRRSNGSGLQHVLESHAHQLGELSIQMSESAFNPHYQLFLIRTGWYGQGFLKVRLPNLRTLELGMQLFTDIHLTSNYLCLFESSLTSLTLHSKTFSYNDIVTLCDVFAKHNNLRMLKIVLMDILSPQLLELFATKLSDLEELRLDFDHLGSDHLRAMGPMGPTRFKEVLWAGGIALAYIFTRWKLRYFTAHARYNGYTTSELEECEKALHTTLPNVITLKLV